MLYVRNPRWLTRGLVLFFAVLLVNHGLPAVLARASGGSALGLNVKAEGGTAGHNSIGIDESSLDSGRFLHFGTLGQWDYQADKKTACPKSIQGLSGQKFSSVGFMYPLEAGEKVKSFCLLRSTQTCCYGPRPQYNQYLLVESAKPVTFARLSPVLVSGTFFAEPNPDEGYIYRMSADAVRTVDEDMPDIDPTAAAQKSHLPLFDYQDLASMTGERSASAVPPELRALDGKKVIVAGYCVDRTHDSPPHLMVSSQWWDGVAQGKPPTIYTSVIVVPADADQLPPLWKPYEVFTGTLHLTSDPAQWSREGIVQLRGTMLGAPGFMPHAHAHAGLLIAWPLEAALLALVLAMSLGRRKHEAPVGAAGVEADAQEAN